MRHRVVKKRLGRDTAHRKSLAMNLSQNLIDNEKVETTLAKAKFVKPKIEKLITKAKKTDKKDKINIFNTVKYLRKHLSSEESVRKLMNDLSFRFEKRDGGYTRIVKTGNRDGDNAKMARLEFVELPKKQNKINTKEKKEVKKETKKMEKEIENEA